MIYFLLFRKLGYIKIGTTVNFDDRSNTLFYEYGEFQPLGFIQGGVKREHELHEQFKACKAPYRREFFHDAAPIREYIAQHATMDHGGLKRLTRRVEISDDSAEFIHEVARRLKISAAEFMEHVLVSAYPEFDKATGGKKE